jgi:cell division protein FtsZ
MLDAFAKADDVLCSATRGISSLITETGVVNLDFADVRSVMRNGGAALMGSGIATGPNAAEDAARMAIHSPLLDDVSIEGATSILVNITGPRSLGSSRSARPPRSSTLKRVRARTCSSAQSLTMQCPRAKCVSP